MSVPHNAMRPTPPYSCLQAPAEKGQPHSMSRLILELEAMCYPSVCFNAFVQIRSAQLAYPLALIMSVPDSLPTTDPIYLYMVHSVGPSLGSQTTLALDPTRYTHIGTLQTPLVLPSWVYPQVKNWQS